MKCDKCKWAKWNRTKNGSLHPDKSGQCTYEVVVLELPAAYYWLISPSPNGGFIKRGYELKLDCVYYEEGEAK